MRLKLSELLLENVRREMAKQELSQVELGKRAGVSKQSVNQILTAGHSPRIDTVEALARGLGIPAWELLRPQEKAPAPDIWAALSKLQAEIESLKAGAIESLTPARKELLAAVQRMPEQAVERLLYALPPNLRSPEHSKKTGSES